MTHDADDAHHGERDARVEAAISNWAPRFLANGVPYIDFVEVTDGLLRWDDWCAAWSERAAVHEGLAATAFEAGHSRTAGEHLVRAAVEYHFAKFLFVDHPGQLRVAHERAVACHRAALPHLDPPAERIEVPFDGGTLVGNLRRPRGSANGPDPVVVMIVGLDSAKEEMGSNEQHFLDRGMATFAFDGPGQGEGEWGLEIRHDYEAPVAAVIDVLAQRPDVDEARIALWGVSLGGYSAARAAALEPRVRACVSVSGPYDLGAAWDGLPPLTRAAFATRSGAAHAADGDVGVAEEARSRAARLSLDGVAEHIRCPLLVVFGGRDRLFGVAGARRLVEEAAGPAELLLVADGNHVVNDRPYRYRSQAADWLASHLGVVATSPRGSLR